MTDIRTTELLPCRFCKIDKELRLMAKHYTDESHVWWVECARCGARGMQSPDGESAIESWNAAWNAHAELGDGECEIETTENWLPAERYHRCKHCGAFFAVMDASGDIPPCVCPNCGKAVKR